MMWKFTMFVFGLFALAILAVSGLQAMDKQLEGVQQARIREATAAADLAERRAAVDAQEYAPRQAGVTVAVVVAVVAAGVGVAIGAAGVGIALARGANLRAETISAQASTGLYPVRYTSAAVIVPNETGAQRLAALGAKQRVSAPQLGRLLESPQPMTALPEPAPSPILLPDLVDLATWHPGHDLALPVGVGPGGKVIDIPLRGDLALVTAAGLPGSGKTSLLRSFAHSIAAQSPGGDRAQLVICDPKRCEFSTLGHGIPWLWRPVARDPDATGRVLHDLRGELDARLRMMEKARQATYQGLGWPVIVCLIDELAILSRDRAIMTDITHISTLGRSAGVVVVAATQRPSAHVMTPELRALGDVAVSFRVRSVNESKLTLAGYDGAEALPADRPGRAIVKRDTLTTVQTFLSPPMPTLGTVPADGLDDDLVEDDDDDDATVQVEGDTQPAYVRQAREMFTQGASRRSIETSIFGYAGGAASAKVNAALQDLLRS